MKVKKGFDEALIVAFVVLRELCDLKKPATMFTKKAQRAQSKTSGCVGHQVPVVSLNHRYQF